MKRLMIIAFVFLFLLYGIIFYSFGLMHNWKTILNIKEKSSNITLNSSVFVTAGKDDINDYIQLDNCAEINQPGKYILKQDILASGKCFTISSNDVVLDGNYHNVIGYKDRDGSGIYIKESKNVTVKNLNIQGFQKGIYIYHTKNSLLNNNGLVNNFDGLYFLYNSDNNTIFNNTFLSNGNSGTSIYSSVNNSFKSNNFVGNFQSIFSSENRNIFVSNYFTRNINTFSEFSGAIKDTDSNKVVDFNITMRDINGSICLNCAYQLELFPSGGIFYNKSSNGIIYGEFIPTQSGIYSLKRKIIDLGNNTQLSKYVFLVNPQGRDTLNYYFRSHPPTHDQPPSLSGRDSGSLLLDKSSIEESRSCGDWVQFSPDDLPPYLYGVVKEINFSIAYTYNSSDAYVGIQRFATYDDKMNKQVQIDSSNGERVSRSFNFTVDWPINYYWEWYWFTIKLSVPQGSPFIYSNPKNDSNAKINYVYSTTPGIKSIFGSKEVSVLSATMEDINKKATIILEGDGVMDISIQMPDKTKHYSVLFDGIDCDINSNCLIKDQSSGELDLSLALHSRHIVEIVPQ